MISVYKRSSIINTCRVNEWMQLYTGSFWHFQPRGMSLALKKKKHLNFRWGNSCQFFPCCYWFQTFCHFSLPCPICFSILACSLALCLDFENRFWTKVLRSWLGNMVWLSLGSCSFLWCKCTKIIGKICHALNSLLRSTIWAYQPLPIHRVKWTSASAQGGWGGRAAQGLSWL